MNLFSPPKDTQFFSQIFVKNKYAKNKPKKIVEEVKTYVFFSKILKKSYIVTANWRGESSSSPSFDVESDNWRGRISRKKIFWIQNFEKIAPRNLGFSPPKLCPLRRISLYIWYFRDFEYLFKISGFLGKVFDIF